MFDSDDPMFQDFSRFISNVRVFRYTLRTPLLVIDQIFDVTVKDTLAIPKSVKNSPGST